MTKIKPETQPEGKGGKAQDKDDTEEVAGRGKRMSLYTCFNDGAGNYVDPTWTWFSCWRCGSMYYV